MSEQDNINKIINAVSGLLTNIENDAKRVRLLLQRLQDGSYKNDIDEEEIKNLSSKLLNYSVPEQWEVVEWVFDGLYMVGSDWKKYPVPLNYSSKSKLLTQDILKLTILPNGKLMYKLIQPAQRSMIKATLSQSNNEYIAIWDNWKTYKLNPAAVSYFWLSIWDQMSIIINADNKWDFAAIEAKL